MHFSNNVYYVVVKRTLLLPQLAAGNVSGLRHCSALLVVRSSSGHFVLVRRAAEHDPEHLGLRRHISCSVSSHNIQLPAC